MKRSILKNPGKPFFENPLQTCCPNFPAWMYRAENDAVFVAKKSVAGAQQSGESDWWTTAWTKYQGGTHNVSKFLLNIYTTTLIGE